MYEAGRELRPSDPEITVGEFAMQTRDAQINNKEDHVAKQPGPYIAAIILT